MQENNTLSYDDIMKKIFSTALERLRKTVPENGEIILSYDELSLLGYTREMGADFEDLRDMAYARNNEFGFLSQCIVFEDIKESPGKDAFVFKFTKPFMDAVVKKLPSAK